MKYWQIAAGADGRSYGMDFLRYGMAFVGGWDNTQLMQHVSEGDCILLKRGLSQVVAAGHVIKRDGRNGGHARNDKDPTKEWLLHYDGWDLPAYRYVDWRLPPQPVATRGLTRAAICQVHEGHLKDIAKTILDDGVSRLLDPEPAPTQVLEDGALIGRLAALAPKAMDQFRDRLTRLRELAQHYDGHWSEVREHETRTFLVVPFLLSLGWREEQIKIELPVRLRGGKGRADVVCFSQAWEGSAKNGVPALVIETKGFSIGLTSAGVQAAEYALPLGCEWAVASNGYCYKVLRRVGEWSDPRTAYQPIAYLNLLRPTERYPLDPDGIAGAADALLYLLPPSPAT